MRKTETKHERKREKKKPEREGRAREERAPGRRFLDWGPLAEAAQDAIDWALDIAARLTRDFPEEVAAVEQVRSFVRARIEGKPASVRLEDVLFTFAVILGAVEVDLEVDGLVERAMAPLQAFAPVLPAELRVPPPRVAHVDVMRRCPGGRTSCAHRAALFTHFAA